MNFTAFRKILAGTFIRFIENVSLPTERMTVVCLLKFVTDAAWWMTKEAGGRMDYLALSWCFFAVVVYFFYSGKRENFLGYVLGRWSFGGLVVA